MIELVRHGWSGDIASTEATLRIVGLFAWNAVALMVARRVIEWEPRT